MKKKVYQGEVSKIIDGDLCEVTVHESGDIFEVYYGEVADNERLVTVGEHLSFIVRFHGENAGDYSAWI